jgi:hypothetical protein
VGWRTLPAVMGRRVLVVTVAALALGALGLAPGRAAAPADVAPALHGAVETQALTAGVGAISLFVDPGTAYAYSTMDRDDYGGGSVSYTMTARGANLNLGTIALAVIWAAPECHPEDPSKSNGPCFLSGGHGTPNTGLQEAGGFPGYAEALYPAPPQDVGRSREAVYKCVLNKDAPGAAPTEGSAADICKSSDAIPLTSWAEAIGDNLASRGFSRAAGFDVPGVLKVAASESRSDVHAADGGKLSSEGYSVLRDISIGGGQITIDSTRASAKIVSGSDGVADRSAACGFEGLTIAGQRVGIDDLKGDGLKPLLDQVEQSAGLRVEILPPSPVVTEVREGGKQVAECTGIRVLITDVHDGSRVPGAPGLGNRFEFTFGRISVAQSVNKFAGPPGAGASGLVDPAVMPEVGNPVGPDVLGASFNAPESPAAIGAGAPSAAPAVGGQPAGGGGTYPSAVPVGGRNLALIGALTAASASAIGFVILLLIGVVGSLATGKPLRIPGLPGR